MHVWNMIFLVFFLVCLHTRGSDEVRIPLHLDSHAFDDVTAQTQVWLKAALAPLLRHKLPSLLAQVGDEKRALELMEEAVESEPGNVLVSAILYLRRCVPLSPVLELRVCFFCDAIEPRRKRRLRIQRNGC